MIRTKSRSLAFQSTAWIVLVAFALSPVSGYAQDLMWMPPPGARVSASPEFVPPLLKGITINPQNPLQLDFLIDQGDRLVNESDKPDEYRRLIKYFLASLTMPEKDMWVNLSPYEQDRIIDDHFGKTEMGRDLLAQDYVLKQLTASMIYPEDDLGKKFWDKVYQAAFEKFGNTDIPLNTFNKVWIVPDQAVVYESGNTAMVLRSHLKVMLDEDYKSLEKNQDSETLGTDQMKTGDLNQVSSVSSQVVREIVLPEIEKEVNEGKNFALLRQIYSAMILATWYKRALKESLLGQVYVDKGKVMGVDLQDKDANQKIYAQYLEAFKKGAYNYIKEDYDKYTQETIPRKYFSGGFGAQYEERMPDGSVRLAGLTELKVLNAATIDSAAMAAEAEYEARVADGFNHVDRASISLQEPGEKAVSSGPRQDPVDAAMLSPQMKKFLIGSSVVAGLLIANIVYQSSRKPAAPASPEQVVTAAFEQAAQSYEADLKAGRAPADVDRQIEKYFYPLAAEAGLGTNYYQFLYGVGNLFKAKGKFFDHRKMTADINGVEREVYFVVLADRLTPPQNFHPSLPGYDYKGKFVVAGNTKTFPLFSDAHAGWANQDADGLQVVLLDDRIRNGAMVLKEEVDSFAQYSDDDLHNMLTAEKAPANAISIISVLASRQEWGNLANLNEDDFYARVRGVMLNHGADHELKHHWDNETPFPATVPQQIAETIKEESAELTAGANESPWVSVITLGHWTGSGPQYVGATAGGVQEILAATQAEVPESIGRYEGERQSRFLWSTFLHLSNDRAKAVLKTAADRVDAVEKGLKSQAARPDRAMLSLSKGRLVIIAGAVGALTIGALLLMPPSDEMTVARFDTNTFVGSTKNLDAMVSTTTRVYDKLLKISEVTGVMGQIGDEIMQMQGTKPVFKTPGYRRDELRIKALRDLEWAASSPFLTTNAAQEILNSPAAIPSTVYKVFNNPSLDQNWAFEQATNRPSLLPKEALMLNPSVPSQRLGELYLANQDSIFNSGHVSFFKSMSTNLNAPDDVLKNMIDKFSGKNTKAVMVKPSIVLMGSSPTVTAAGSTNQSAGLQIEVPIIYPAKEIREAAQATLDQKNGKTGGDRAMLNTRVQRLVAITMVAAGLATGLYMFMRPSNPPVQSIEVIVTSAFQEAARRYEADVRAGRAPQDINQHIEKYFSPLADAAGLPGQYSRFLAGADKMFEGHGKLLDHGFTGVNINGRRQMVYRLMIGDRLELPQDIPRSLKDFEYKGAIHLIDNPQYFPSSFTSPIGAWTHTDSDPRLQRIIILENELRKTAAMLKGAMDRFAGVTDDQLYERLTAENVESPLDLINMMAVRREWGDLSGLSDEDFYTKVRPVLLRHRTAHEIGHQWASETPLTTAFLPEQAPAVDETRIEFKAGVNASPWVSLHSFIQWTGADDPMYAESGGRGLQSLHNAIKTEPLTAEAAQYQGARRTRVQLGQFLRLSTDEAAKMFEKAAAINEKSWDLAAPADQAMLSSRQKWILSMTAVAGLWIGGTFYFSKDIRSEQAYFRAFQTNAFDSSRESMDELVGRVMPLRAELDRREKSQPEWLFTLQQYIVAVQGTNRVLTTPNERNHELLLKLRGILMWAADSPRLTPGAAKEIFENSNTSDPVRSRILKNPNIDEGWGYQTASKKQHIIDVTSFLNNPKITPEHFNDLYFKNKADIMNFTAGPAFFTTVAGSEQVTNEALEDMLQTFQGEEEMVTPTGNIVVVFPTKLIYKTAKENLEKRRGEKSAPEKPAPGRASAEPVGGIDFNAVNLNLQIKRDGQGVPLPMNLQNIQDIHVEGFIPVITDITPVSQLPLVSSDPNAQPATQIN